MRSNGKQFTVSKKVQNQHYKQKSNNFTKKYLSLTSAPLLLLCLHLTHPPVLLSNSSAALLSVLRSRLEKAEETE